MCPRQRFWSARAPAPLSTRWKREALAIHTREANLSEEIKIPARHKAVQGRAQSKPSGNYRSPATFHRIAIRRFLPY